MWTTLRPFLRDAITGLAYRSGLSAPSRILGRLAVVTFHRVLPAAQRNEYPTPELAVTPDELDWYLGFFTQAFECGPLTASYAALSDDPSAGARPRLAITFDDGQLDNLEHAAPVLERHGVHATFYVVSQAVGQTQPLWHDRIAYAWPEGDRAKQRRAVSLLANEVGIDNIPRMQAGGTWSVGDVMAVLKRQVPELALRVVGALEAEFGSHVPAWDKLMTWTDVRTLEAAGHEIGAHSRTHAILPHCDEPRLEQETAGAKREIEAELGHAVTSFCYPNGDHDDRVVAAVRRAGFDNAVTTRFGLNPPAATPFRLRRCDVQSASSRTAWGHLSPSRLAWRIAALPGSG